jgi:hypothetical protein
LPHGAAQLGPQGAAQLLAGQQLLRALPQQRPRRRPHLPASASAANANTMAARADNAKNFRIML